MLHLSCNFLCRKSLSIEKDGVVVTLYILLVGKYSVRERTWATTKPFEVSRYVFQCLHVNDGIVPEIGYDRFLPNPFQFIVQESCHSSMLHSVV
jgi:hypothetical protein